MSRRNKKHIHDNDAFKKANKEIRVKYEICKEELKYKYIAGSSSVSVWHTTGGRNLPQNRIEKRGK